MNRRVVIIQIGQPGEDGREFRGLRISGRVEKTSGGEPNTATIEIINPSEDSIAAAQEPGAMIRVLAGREREPVRLLFQGDINRGGATYEMSGVDTLLKIEAQDGGRRLRAATVNESFGGEVTGEQIFGVLADSLGVPLGNIDLGESDLRWPRGLAIAGPARSELDHLTRSLGLAWSIQDGALQVLPEGDDTGELAVVVSSANGNLIGSPRPGDDGLEVTALLDGRIRPGRRIVVESRQFEGIYRSMEVTHIFDSGWDQNFYSVVVAQEVS